MMRKRRGGVIAVAVLVAWATAVVGCTVDPDGTRIPQQSATYVDRPDSPSAEASPAVVAWAGPVRRGATWPVVSSEPMGSPSNPWFGWVDRRDAEIGWVDIRRMSGFSFEFRGQLPAAPMLGQLQRIEYGVVVDSDGDRVADCQIGFDNHGPNPPSYRVWLKDLKTGSTVEKIGADFGPPLDWGFSEGVPGEPAFVSFRSARGSRSLPCDPFHGPVTYYAYAAVSDNGRVTAWDYAPDAAWLRKRPG